MSEIALQLSLMALEAALAGAVLLALFRLRGLIVSQHFASPLAVNPFSLPPQLFAQQPRLFVVGTLSLFIDTVLIIIVYETVSRTIRSLFLRIYVSLALVLIVDTLLFVTG